MGSIIISLKDGYKSREYQNFKKKSIYLCLNYIKFMVY